jgi:hypothetical protein
MVRKVAPTISPRHAFVFDTIPTIRGSMYGGGDVYPNRCRTRNPADDYAAVLDCVIDMADALVSGNGARPDDAVGQVLRDEDWRILPSHRAMIVHRLRAQR